jgi:hypothetical protein
MKPDDQRRYVRENALQFAEKFMGYGDPKRPYWAIGLEEGGCGTTSEPDVDDAYRRLYAWNQGGKPSWLELNSFLQQSGIGEVSNPVWDVLAHCFSPLVGNDPQACIGKEFPTSMASHLFLCELQPLPCKGTGQWPWKHWLDEKYAKKAAWKRGEVVQNRIIQLGALIKTHAPDVVIGYGISDRPIWQRLCQEAGRTLCEPDVSFIRAGSETSPRNSIFLFPHPTGQRQHFFANSFFGLTGSHLKQCLRA